MSDPDNSKQGKGFKGLQSLGSKTPESSAPVEKKPDPPVLPSAWEEGITQQTTQPQPMQSQTAAPSWRGWVIGLGVLAAIAIFFNWAGNQSSSGSSYSPSTATDYSSSAPVVPPPGPSITMPPVGNGLVLTSDQIRYCVYEDRRIKGAERAVDNYDETSVITFNAMVDDYNSRCSHFRYSQGALAPIESEADQIQTQLEQEGQGRISNSTSAGAAQVTASAAAADAASASASVYASAMPSDIVIRDFEADIFDEADAAAEAAADDAVEVDSKVEASGGSAAYGNSSSTDPKNLQICLSGNYPSLCERSLLTESQEAQVAEAERRENLRLCLSGNYPSLCKHSILSDSERLRVGDAERSVNLRTCLSGNYPSLCKRSLLTEAERTQVDQAERRENLQICLSGNYPSLCKRSLLTESERGQVDEAERRENLRICMSGNYPSLCNRSLLTDSEMIEAARVELGR